MGDIPNQTGVTGTPITAINLASYVTLTNGDAISSYAIATGALPPGLTLNTTTGAITGTPTVAGTYNITVTATDNDGASNADAIQFIIDIPQAAPVMGNVPDQAGVSGTAFNLAVAPYVTLTNGDAITTYTLTGALPTGVSFDTTTGILSGTPTQTGTFPLSVTATDNDGASNSDAFNLVIAAAPDTTPDAFALVDQNDVAVSTVITSAPITVQ